jgi:hypothetical protein
LTSVLLTRSKLFDELKHQLHQMKLGKFPTIAISSREDNLYQLKSFDTALSALFTSDLGLCSNIHCPNANICFMHICKFLLLILHLERIG